MLSSLIGHKLEKDDNETEEPKFIMLKKIKLIIVLKTFRALLEGGQKSIPKMPQLKFCFSFKYGTGTVPEIIYSFEYQSIPIGINHPSQHSTDP